LKTECGCAYQTPEAQERGQRSFDWTASQISNRNREYLASLPDNISFHLLTKTLCFVHGSPRRINEYLYEDRPVNAVKHALGSSQIDLLFCGHTHLAYHREIDGIHLINPGSVGKPKDGDPRASYTWVELTSDKIDVRFERVCYDVAAASAAIRSTELPSYFAEALEEAKS
jgi:diadenosine tetraphosphatase ApaH/serine/threonine PP2A family protein phosphatase